jgi:hypothetical protein
MTSLANGKSANVTTPITEDISIGSGAEDGIELNGSASLTQNLTEEELEKQKLMEEYREELVKIQEDISTLRLVLNDKLKRENELKTLLGVTFVAEMKQDFTEGFNQIRSTNAFKTAAQTITGIGSTVSSNEAYQKTTASVKQASSKITPAFQQLGGAMKNSLGNLRNSAWFNSIETGLSSSLSSVKLKASQSEFNVDGSPVSTNGIPTSKSTLGTTTNGNNGLSKHDTITEEKNN